MNDALNYNYQYDPHFDFETRNVDMDHSIKGKKNKHNIKKYYENIEDNKSEDLESSLKSQENERKPHFHTLESTQRHSDKADKRPRRKMCSDYNLTKTIEADICPAKMKSRPKYKLKEVCENNNYQISYSDFKDDKILLGNGAFGEVYLVCCKLNNCKYALKVISKERVIRSGHENHLMREKDISNLLNHPNIVRLESYFHDSDNCYFLFEV